MSFLLSCLSHEFPSLLFVSWVSFSPVCLMSFLLSCLSHESPSLLLVSCVFFSPLCLLGLLSPPTPFLLNCSTYPFSNKILQSSFPFLSIYPHILFSSSSSFRPRHHFLLYVPCLFLNLSKPLSHPICLTFFTLILILLDEPPSLSNHSGIPLWCVATVHAPAPIISLMMFPPPLSCPWGTYYIQQNRPFYYSSMCYSFPAIHSDRPAIILLRTTATSSITWKILSYLNQTQQAVSVTSLHCKQFSSKLSRRTDAAQRLAGTWQSLLIY